MNKIIQGDCLEKLKELEDNSVDSIVTDPPYHLVSIVKRFGKEGSAPAKEVKDGSFKRLSGGFMGKTWDGVDENGKGIAYNVDMWKECLRVLKPGGQLLAFGGTRTYHRMAVAIEDAGFEVRDMIEWVYGSGFPKSLNIGKAVDKIQGNEREIVGETRIDKTSMGDASGWDTSENMKAIKESGSVNITKGTSEWEGWGTALKPAHEPICMARKPLRYWETKNTLTAKEKDEFQDLWDKMEAGMPYDEKRYEELWAKKEVKVFKSLSVAENCLKYGTGGINIDECRVAIPEDDKANYDFNNNGLSRMSRPEGEKLGQFDGGWKIDKTKRENTQGRFPSNLIHDNSEEVRECFPDTNVGARKAGQLRHTKDGDLNFTGNTYTVNDYPANSGNASRFFKSIIYQAKASKSERNKGCEGLEEKERIDYGGFHSEQGLINNNRNPENRKPTTNNHPTVKPIALMEYLIKMVTPKGGIVLDPFAGSGSTLVAAKQNGFQYIGIELTEEYIPIIEARLNTLNQDKLL